MSRGQTPRTPEHFPRMKVRGGARRDRAWLADSARALARFERRANELAASMAALGRAAEAATAVVTDMSKALTETPRLPWWRRFWRRRG